jgi:hypothetical protein
MRLMLEQEGEGISGKTALVSGSGNVALYCIEKLIELGATVLTASDSDGFIHDPRGITREKLDWLIDLKENRRGRIQEYAEKFGCDYHEGKTPWGVKADLAFPCATQNELEAEDATAMLKNGVRAVAEGANIDLPDGSRFLEAHAKGPDGVMIAAIEPLNVPARDFVTLTGRTFSEVQSSSGPVSDFEPVRAFYEEVLGVPMGFRYEFHSESFSRMVGVDQTLHIRANNYGRVIEDVMLGIIHYGLPPGTYADLRERARPPNRGIVGVRLRVEELDALLQRCERAGVERVRDPATVRLHSGTMRIAAVRAPHGVWHWAGQGARHDVAVVH